MSIVKRIIFLVAGVLTTYLIIGCQDSTKKSENEHNSVTAIRRDNSIEISKGLDAESINKNLIDNKKVGLNAPLVIKNKCINDLCLTIGLEQIVSTDQFFVRDTIMEEEATWPGKSFYTKKNELMLIAESNWKDKKKVSRFIIYSNRIRTEDSLCVGMMHKEIRASMSNDIPTVPDGTILLKHKKYRNVFFEYDTDYLNEESKLYYGVNSLNEVPDTLRVKYILIM